MGLWLAIKILGGVIGSYFALNPFVSTKGDLVESGGVSFFAAFRRKKGGAVCRFSAAMHELKGSFEVNPREFFDPRAKNSVSPTFDEAVVLQSDSPQFISALRSSVALQAALVELLSYYGAKRVRLEDGELTAWYSQDQTKSAEAKASFAHAIEELRKFAGRFQPEDDPYFERTRLVRQIFGVIVGFAIAQFVQAAFYGRTTILVYGIEDFIYSTWPLAAVAVGLAIVWVFLLLRESTRLVRLLFGWWFMIGVIPVAFFGIALDANILADLGSVKIYDREILQRRIVTSGSGRNRKTGYWVDLSGHELPEWVEVSGSQYDSFKEGWHVDEAVSPGAFGFPWIKSIETK